MRARGLGTLLACLFAVSCGPEGEDRSPDPSADDSRAPAVERGGASPESAGESSGLGVGSLPPGPPRVSALPGPEGTGGQPGANPASPGSAPQPSQGSSPGSATGSTPQPSQGSFRASPAAGDLDLAAIGHTEGSAAAPLQIIEFSDFACGYCRKFHLETWPTLEKEYVATGKAQWKYVPMILGMFGPNAEDAANAGECAQEQDRFPAMRDALFEKQAEWKRVRDAIPVFRGYAEELGLDVERWQRCMDEGRRSARVAAGTRISREVGVRGTPTFFVVGYGAVPGAIPLELFRQVLDTAWADRAGRGGS